MPLSPLIRFGTPTWTYEGWQGQVYKKQYAKSSFTRECLGEYCQYQYHGTEGAGSPFVSPGQYGEQIAPTMNFFVPCPRRQNHGRG